MRWPWTKRCCDHATLTMTPEGGVVIGWPRGSTERDCSETLDGVEQWLQDPDRGRSTLMFPWPVDVVDLRK